MPAGTQFWRVRGGRASARPMPFHQIDAVQSCETLRHTELRLSRRPASLFHSAAKIGPRKSVRRRAGSSSYLLERPINGRRHGKEHSMIMSELSSPRRHGKQRSHAVINRAIGAGLFAAGIGLCVVLSHAPAQSSVEVEADSADNTVSRSIIGSAFSIVGDRGLRVAIGDPSDGVSAPLGGAGLDVAVGDPSDGVSAPLDRAGLDVAVGDPADGVSAPLDRVGLDVAVGDPSDGVSAPIDRVGIGDPADGVSAPLNRTPTGD
jgi:hypothetical protein